jgi:ring-1,2-phenylacetyl-CoA epoxidase subunit PaaA
MKWKIKLKSNDELRQRFVDLTVPQAKAVDLNIPDPELKYNEDTGHWDFGEINWNEFFDVIKGKGPMNSERIGVRRKAHSEGEWVRKAAEAYHQKKKQTQPD